MGRHVVNAWKDPGNKIQEIALAKHSLAESQYSKVGEHCRPLAD